MEPRTRVAREAARLIYRGVAREYKEAKEMASVSLGIKQLPSNFEVARELDRISEEREGGERSNLLRDMRKTALKVMNELKEFDPCLIGSVWRGTARRGSDIDIVIYSQSPGRVEDEASKSFEVIGTEDEAFLVDGLPEHACHIRLLVDGFEVEVVVRPQGERGEERCEIYGDVKWGIDTEGLEELMKGDPLRRYVPRRRPR